MSILSFLTLSKQPVAKGWPLTGRIEVLIRYFFIWVLVALLIIPVILLFLGTAVPAYLSAALLLTDALLIILWLRGTLLNTFSMLLACLLVAAIAVGVSQSFASTPPITDGKGNPLPGSIAVMEKVVLGGNEEWIIIRGKDSSKPVLLYLGIGGPGAGGFPASALTLAPLEDHFVVVNWDQPGTGKSYHAVEISTLTVDKFVSDAHELTEMLRARFHQDKIYLLGLSWGTIVGIKLIEQYPDLFYAYVGTGQMVNTTENDRIGYELALKIASESGNQALHKRLSRNGPPPYSGKGMALKYAAYNNVLFRYMDSPTLDLVLLLVPQFAHEYGLLDKVNFARGLLDSFPVLYPQLRDLDFTSQAARLGLPVYFLVGRNDVNAVASLVEGYYQGLSAPQKELIWLDGGHGASAQQLAEILVNRVLKETYPGGASGTVPVPDSADAKEE